MVVLAVILASRSMLVKLPSKASMSHRTRLPRLATCVVADSVFQKSSRLRALIQQRIIVFDLRA